METSALAAWMFTGLIAIAGAFQLALAAGVPWGQLAMGGRFPGRLPPAMRVAAIVQASVLAGLAVVVLVRAGLVRAGWRDASETLVWIVVAISALSLVMNLVTPSRWERILWAPVALGLLVSSLVVAIG